MRRGAIAFLVLGIGISLTVVVDATGDHGKILFHPKSPTLRGKRESAIEDISVDLGQISPESRDYEALNHDFDLDNSPVNVTATEEEELLLSGTNSGDVAVIDALISEIQTVATTVDTQAHVVALESESSVAVETTTEFAPEVTEAVPEVTESISPTSESLSETSEAVESSTLAAVPEEEKIEIAQIFSTESQPTQGSTDAPESITTAAPESENQEKEKSLSPEVTVVNNENDSKKQGQDRRLLAFDVNAQNKETLKHILEARQHLTSAAPERTTATPVLRTVILPKKEIVVETSSEEAVVEEQPLAPLLLDNEAEIPDPPPKPHSAGFRPLTNKNRHILDSEVVKPRRIITNDIPSHLFEKFRRRFTDVTTRQKRETRLTAAEKLRLVEESLGQRSRVRSGNIDHSEAQTNQFDAIRRVSKERGVIDRHLLKIVPRLVSKSSKPSNDDSFRDLPLARDRSVQSKILSNRANRRVLHTGSASNHEEPRQEEILTGPRLKAEPNSIIRVFQQFGTTKKAYHTSTRATTYKPRPAIVITTPSPRPKSRVPTTNDRDLFDEVKPNGNTAPIPADTDDYLTDEEVQSEKVFPTSLKGTSQLTRIEKTGSVASSKAVPSVRARALDVVTAPKARPDRNGWANRILAAVQG